MEIVLGATMTCTWRIVGLTHANVWTGRKRPWEACLPKQQTVCSVYLTLYQLFNLSLMCSTIWIGLSSESASL